MNVVRLNFGGWSKTLLAGCAAIALCVAIPVGSIRDAAAAGQGAGGHKAGSADKGDKTASDSVKGPRFGMGRAQGMGRSHNLEDRVFNFDTGNVDGQGQGKGRSASVRGGKSSATGGPPTGKGGDLFGDLYVLLRDEYGVAVPESVIAYYQEVTPDGTLLYPVYVIADGTYWVQKTETVDGSVEPVYYELTVTPWVDQNGDGEWTDGVDTPASVILTDTVKSATEISVPAYYDAATSSYVYWPDAAGTSVTPALMIWDSAEGKLADENIQPFVPETVELGRLNVSRAFSNDKSPVAATALYEAVALLTSGTIEITDSQRLSVDDVTVDAPAANLALYETIIKLLTVSSGADAGKLLLPTEGTPTNTSPTGIYFDGTNIYLQVEVVEKADEGASSTVTQTITIPYAELYDDGASITSPEAAAREVLLLTAPMVAAAFDKFGSLTVDKLVSLNDFLKLNIDYASLYSIVGVTDAD